MIGSGDYVPILKGRAGEYGALESMPFEQRERTVPLIEIPPIPWDHKNGRPSKSIDKHLSKVDSNLERSWGPQRPFLIDLLRINERERMRDRSHPLAHLFGSLRSRRLRAIPVTGLDRDATYQLLCRQIIKMDGCGACLRLQPPDFEDLSLLESAVTKTLAEIGSSERNVDLLLDLGSLRDVNSQVVTPDVTSMIEAIPCLNGWRSFILAATAFPVDLMGLPPSQISVVERSEWPMWRSAATDKRVKRRPTFGDYAISHPEPSEVDPRIMRPSASIRYTGQDSWLILKGQNLKDHGYSQFHSVSKRLLRANVYAGPGFSWGDQYIKDCADGLVGTGNLTTWRRVGTSHHIAQVMQQLASRDVA